MNDVLLKKGKANLFMGIAFMLFGCIISGIILIEQYPLWSGKNPGRGLFPAIAAGGIILSGFGIVVSNFIQIKRKRGEDEEVRLTIRALEVYNLSVVIGIAILIVFLTKYLGFLPCVTIGTIFYTRFLAQEKWRKCLIIGLGTGLVMYLVFVLFLKVNFPVGIFGI